MENSLPPIPAKRYFTIGEVGELCGVKPHVLRYWEQEFTQLRPVKRRGNRRYYQHHEVLMIRRIRDLLYEQGFTISGARNKLQEMRAENRPAAQSADEVQSPAVMPAQPPMNGAVNGTASTSVFLPAEDSTRVHSLRDELLLLRNLLAWEGAELRL